MPHAYQRLAEIAAFEQAHEGRWGIIEAFGHILAIADSSIGDSRRANSQEIRIMLGGEFVVDEAAQGEAFCQYGAHGCGEQVWSGRLAGRTVLRDQSAHRHT